MNFIPLTRQNAIKKPSQFEITFKVNEIRSPSGLLTIFLNILSKFELRNIESSGINIDDKTFTFNIDYPDNAKGCIACVQKEIKEKIEIYLQGFHFQNIQPTINIKPIYKEETK